MPGHRGQDCPGRKYIPPEAKILNRPELKASKPVRQKKQAASRRFRLIGAGPKCWPRPSWRFPTVSRTRVLSARAVNPNPIELRSGATKWAPYSVTPSFFEEKAADKSLDFTSATAYARRSSARTEKKVPSSRWTGLIRFSWPLSPSPAPSWSVPRTDTAFEYYRRHAPPL